MNNIFGLFSEVKYEGDANTAEKLRYFTITDAYSLVWMDSIPEKKERTYCPKQREHIIERYTTHRVQLIELFANAYYAAFVTVCEEMGYDHSAVTRDYIMDLGKNGLLGKVNPFRKLGGDVYNDLISRKNLPDESRQYKNRRL